MDVDKGWRKVTLKSKDQNELFFRESFLGF